MQNEELAEANLTAMVPVARDMRAGLSRFSDGTTRQEQAQELGAQMTSQMPQQTAEQRAASDVQQAAQGAELDAEAERNGDGQSVRRAEYSRQRDELQRRRRLEVGYWKCSATMQHH